MFERVSTVHPYMYGKTFITTTVVKVLQHSKLFFLFKSTKISASKMVTVCSVYLLLAPIHKEIKVMSMSANIEEVERMEGHKEKEVFFDLWLFVAFMVQYINSRKELSAAMEQNRPFPHSEKESQVL